MSRFITILAFAALVLGVTLKARADDADEKAAKLVKDLRGVTSR
jgi:hypothetical protein